MPFLFIYIMLSEFLLKNHFFSEVILVAYRGIEPRTPWLKVKCSTDWASKPHMAGIAGFEPTNTTVKVWCLTTWRYPYMGWTMGLEPTTTRTTIWRSTNWTTSTIHGASSGDRTRDTLIKSQVLYQLS